MRCFIALEIPEHIRSKIFHKFENLKNKNLFGGKFVEKQNLHLTLKFLGSLTNEEIENVKRDLKEVKFHKFSCEVGKPGFFDAKYIRVIWIELLSDKLKELHEKIDLTTSRIQKDYKQFNSHITTARVNSVFDKKSLIQEIKNIHLRNLNFDVNEFVLMKSELTKQGTKYKILDRFNLEN
jgi:2'-5' RNA ligase